jgi:Haem-binding uptake, Tiki superfamily, ChaN
MASTATAIHVLTAVQLCAALMAASGCGQAQREGKAPGAEAPDPAAVLEAALDRVRLVAIGESHAIEQHGAFLEKVIESEAINRRLDDIVVEFGSADHQDVIDRYVTGEAVPAAEIDRLLRDTTQLEVWESPIYRKIFAAVRRANRRRPAARPLRVLLGDPAIDWTATRTAEQYRAVADERDRHFAALVEREVLARGRRALLLMGSYHALKKGTSRATVGSLIERRHPGSLFVVMLYAGMGPHSARVEAALSRGSAPAIVVLSTSWIGGLPARSAFVLPPVLQLPTGLMLRDIADAYLYLGPAASLTRVPPTIGEDSDHLRELERRYPIVLGQPRDAR